MSKKSAKFKKVIRSLSEKAGVSHAGAVNILRKNAPDPGPLRPLDPVFVAALGDPGVGVISSINGDQVLVTAVHLRRTPNGLSFSPIRGSVPILFSSKDVLPFPLEDDEVSARFAEDLFKTVDSVEEKHPSIRDGYIPYFVIQKSAGDTAFVVGESADNIFSVSAPKNVVMYSWSSEAYLERDGVFHGIDAVMDALFVRKRAMALFAAVAAGGESPSPPPGADWFVELDDVLSPDHGIVLSRPPSGVRYACGSGKVGKHHNMNIGIHGLAVLSSEVTVVNPRLLPAPVKTAAVTIPSPFVTHDSVADALAAVQSFVAERPSSRLSPEDGGTTVLCCDDPVAHAVGWTCFRWATDEDGRPRFDGEGSRMEESLRVSVHVLVAKDAIGVLDPRLRRMMMTAPGRMKVAAWMMSAVSLDEFLATESSLTFHSVAAAVAQVRAFVAARPASLLSHEDGGTTVAPVDAPRDNAVGWTCFRRATDGDGRPRFDGDGDRVDESLTVFVHVSAADAADDLDPRLRDMVRTPAGRRKMADWMGSCLGLDEFLATESLPRSGVPSVSDEVE